LVKRFHYAWVVAVVTWITLLAAAGFRSTPSTLIVPLEHEFGWSRATISLAVSINLLLFGLFAPFAGGLMERFGVRRVVVGALLTVSAGSALTVFMREPWQLDLLWGVVVGIGTGSMASVLAATVASRWFVQRRGLGIQVAEGHLRQPDVGRSAVGARKDRMRAMAARPAGRAARPPRSHRRRARRRERGRRRRSAG